MSTPVASSREMARSHILAALSAGETAQLALLAQRLSRFDPPHADDLLMAAVARLWLQDRGGGADLLRRALVLAPRHVLAAKALARIGGWTETVLEALAWHAETDAEAVEFLRLHAQGTGRAVAFIANRAVQCAVPPGGGHVALEWAGHVLVQRQVPPAADASFIELPLPDALRGAVDPEVYLDGCPVLASAVRGAWLQPPRLTAVVAQATGGELLVRAMDLACPDRPVAIILLDGDQVRAQLSVTPPPGSDLEDLPQQTPQELSLAGINNPRLLFALTGEPLDLPQPIRRLSGPEPVVDVIVPVYGDIDATRVCFDRLLNCDPGLPMRVIAIDDRGPEPAIAPLLDRLAAAGHILLRRNPTNLGFVRSVNIGMAISAGARDVVLLNADTAVATGWLKRLHDAAGRAADIGTVTPWSNDATICSYPRANEETALAEVDVPALNALVGTVLDGQAIDIPTAVGFCMYIRRDCLAQTGWFDAVTFGTGYGEENDFCLRAGQLGWRHVMALDAYVGHVGGGSFGPSKQGRVDRALRRLARLYPGYEPSVHAFIDTDPLAVYRRALDRARLFRDGGQRPLMIVCARLGGGTERFVQEGLARRPGGGRDAVLLRPEKREGKPHRLNLELTDRPDLGNLCYDPATELDLLWSDLARLGVMEMELHHPFHLTPDTLAGLANRFTYRMHLHDYSWICPRITLTDGTDRYCGEPDVAACESCVATHGDLLQTGLGVADWRMLTRAVLEKAQRLDCATQEAAQRLRRYAPAARLHLMPPQGLPPSPTSAVPPRQPGEVLRIVVPGAIGPPKGFHILLDCARDAVARQLPLRFIVLGYTLDDDLLVSTGGAMVIGRYEDTEFGSLLADIRPHGAFVPSVWPETWCYALSHVLAAGLPTAVFNIGAQAERLRAHGRGLLLPPGLPAAAINDALLALSAPC
ncbi:glycosyltransferase [Niveispirillum sp. SYP-B3756]|uniref:glycosyltransferase n=1 Tax=Niveispirillum sp. SYP-B3756 TaxID=2662178 RepID=UPI00129181EC|nr:glycosyltransferase [Niveispirillum sp. SYP-B3756]